MFSKKETGFKEGVDTLIGVNTTFTGNIEAEGTVRVDGRVKGDIKVGGDIYVGDRAVITGGIAASSVHLAGTVEGNITCSGILKILSTAKLYGDIKVNSFVADEGALFQGKCSMMDASEAENLPGKSQKRNYRKSTVLDDVYEEKEKEKEKEKIKEA